MSTDSRTSRAADRRAKRPERIDPHQSYSILEAGAALDCSRATIYNMITAGELRTLKRGARVVVPGAEIIRLNTVSV